MILNDAPIDVSLLFAALEQYPELGYAHLEPGQTMSGSEENRRIVEDGLRVFTEFVEDSERREDELRRALCWLLNLSDGDLAEILVAARMPFPNGAIDQRRGYLQLLWGRGVCRLARF